MSGPECKKCGEHFLECECKSPGRPEAKIDWSLVDDMLKAGSNGVEVAQSLGIDPETLYNRCKTDNNLGFSDYCQEKKAIGIGELRIAQHKKALGKGRGDSSMLKHLGEWRLGQKEIKNADGSESANRDIIVFTGKIKKENPVLFESLRPYLEDQQPLLHQGPEGEQSQISTQLGTEDTL